MSIVFGTTLRPDCETSAEVALLLATRMNTHLRIVHVSEDARAPFVLGTDEEHILGPIRPALLQQARRLGTLHPTAVHTHLASGAVAKALCSVAEFEAADMLVVGEGERTSRSLMGGTAERTARECVTPVLMLRDPSRMQAWLRGERPLRMVIGTDLGAAAGAARAFAAKLAALGPVEVDVVLVASPSEVHGRFGLDTAGSGVLSNDAMSALKRDLERSAPPGEQNATVHVFAARGTADVHLVTHAEQSNADLLVVGQRRRSLVNELWYGSVARAVLRSSPVSVACVPVTNVVRPTFQAPRVVLAATDFSEVGARALVQALGMVAEGGVVHVAHVIAPAPSAQEGRRVTEQAWYDLAKECEKVTSLVLERHVVEGAPAPQLLALAALIGADLIVLGARTHSVVGVLLGSVAQAVVSAAKCPVLLVPASAQ